MIGRHFKFVPGYDGLNPNAIRTGRRHYLVWLAAIVTFLHSANLLAEKNVAPGNRRDLQFQEEDRNLWSLHALRTSIEPPEVTDSEWPTGLIDRFVLARLEQAGFRPAPEADRRTLIRRLTFDLHGLPPTPEQIEEFVADSSPDAYRRLVDRLLESPRYGEQWGRHWLDLVRFAESDGYKADHYRPEAWRYRDYVIDAFNEDVPYNEFVFHQLAGDEIAPTDPDSLIAASFLRLGIYEYNQVDAQTQWDVILNDITEVTGDVFLGLGMNCARCHDHKFDPILREDYYRLQAFFAPILFRDDVPVDTFEKVEAYRQRLVDWEARTADQRAELERLESPHREAFVQERFERFPEEIQGFISKPVTSRTPYEHQIAELAKRQMIDAERTPDAVKTKLKEVELARWEELTNELSRTRKELAAPPMNLLVTDVGPFAPETYIPGTGQDRAIAPGFLMILDPKPAQIYPPSPAPNSTGRRLALARWITRPDNQLSLRVIVNRIWQYHFGQGLVPTSSDFGRLGEPPSHPLLLDWLATEFVKNGWSIKALHREILASATYMQSYHHPRAADAMQLDPLNRLLWHAPVRRLAAEEIRDAMLMASGELDVGMGGPSADSHVPRRAVYTKVLRNTRDPLTDLFDAPDRITSCSRRYVTTTAPQSLFMINSGYTLERARSFASRLDATADVPVIVAHAFNLAYGRQPTSAEIEDVTGFLIGDNESGQSIASDRLEDFCHVLINSNEFLHVE